MIHKAMIRLFPSAVILFITLILCACGNSEPEPGVYEEKKSFEYKLYFLEMNEEGRFAIEDESKAGWVCSERNLLPV